MTGHWKHRKSPFYQTLTGLLAGACILLAGCQKTSLQSPNFLEELNQFRSTGGECGVERYSEAPEVSFNDQLAEAALNHAIDMENRGYFDHTSPEGEGVGDRVTTTGYSWTLLAENIARGQKSAEEALASWKKSEGHCINLRNPGLREIGLASAGPYWVLVLGTSR